MMCPYMRYDRLAGWDVPGCTDTILCKHYNSCGNHFCKFQGTVNLELKYQRRRQMNTNFK